MTRHDRPHRLPANRRQRARRLLAAANLCRLCGEPALALGLVEDGLGCTDDPQLRSQLLLLQARIGARSPAREPLTSQELHVALLVADGATNQETASALFVSSKTVEFHLGNVYRKLSVRSRTEMARALASRISA